MMAAGHSRIYRDLSCVKNYHTPQCHRAETVLVRLLHKAKQPKTNNFLPPSSNLGEAFPPTTTTGARDDCVEEGKKRS
ncbi:hypothetical protein CERZMDRAFT_91287 [Cercospora zeae-maydis SCOH1-5]|uniref:Uncharacterized protein n=1 Tax=Cercospora zeae-maydis SCOH1-5 TaxID=717836 RepID=A0A6A6F773_9PEZI|nr:hypothetical protein CERZMDRAFT_91287 [Cercospora zeae-maydis SCOH1-5]